jgi:hypothetical protein
MLNRHHLSIGLIAGAIGLSMIAGAANAIPIEVRDGNGGNVFNGGPGAQGVTIYVSGTTKGVNAGAFALQYKFVGGSTWTDFLTYCLEPDETLDISGLTPKSGNFIPDINATAEYAASATSIENLYNTWFLDSLGNSTKSAAFQVALWELAYDTGSNLSAGLFRLTAAPAAVTTQANTYLNSSLWTTGPDVGVILRVGNQDLLLRVPEPATLGLLGASLIGLGFIRRRNT